MQINNNIDCFSNNVNKFYAGIDLHKNYSFVTVMDYQGYVCHQNRYENQAGTLVPGLTQLAKEYNKQIEATVESTYGWYWLADKVQAADIKLFLAHPAKVNAIAGKKKTDKEDSKILADLLRTRLLPQSYIPSRQERSMKELFRFRLLIVGQRSTIKRRIRDILAKQNIACDLTDILGKKAQAWLKSLNCPYPYQDEIEKSLDIANHLNKQIKALDDEIKTQVKNYPQAELLQSIPGIGQVLSLILACEIGDIHRFPNNRSLAAYAGVVPSVKSSGDKTYLGKTGKRGNKYIRFCLAEATTHAVKKDPELKLLYDRILKKKNKKAIARMAVMNKLSRIVYAVLKNNRPYEYRPRFIN